MEKLEKKVAMVRECKKQRMKKGKDKKTFENDSLRKKSKKR